MFDPSNDEAPDKDRTPDEWAKRGQSLPRPAERLAYFEGGLKRDPRFHAQAWYGIGLARVDLKDN